jgi:hypothetical protein
LVEPLPLDAAALPELLELLVVSDDPPQPAATPAIDTIDSATTALTVQRRLNDDSRTPTEARLINTPFSKTTFVDLLYRF